MRGTDLYASPRPITLLVSEIADADAIKTTIATSASAASYSGADLDGADANPGPAYPTPTNTGQVVTDVPQYPTATAASHASSYVDGSEITFTGTYGGEATTRTATVVGTDGNATFVADGPLDMCSQIDVDAQADALGAWTFGWTDVGSWKETGGAIAPPRAVRGSGADGVIKVGDADGHTDLTPFIDGETQYIEPHRIYASGTTVTYITLYR
jgi:hypothetical protein